MLFFQCPENVYKKNGEPCKSNIGFCFNGSCPTRDNSCTAIWGQGSKASEQICYIQFNILGTMRGNCGFDATGNYIKCSHK